MKSRLALALVLCIAFSGCGSGATIGSAGPPASTPASPRANASPQATASSSASGSPSSPQPGTTASANASPSPSVSGSPTSTLSAMPGAAECSAIPAAASGGTIKITSATYTSGTPSYCDVIGTIEGTITFEVGLPTAWQGRLYVVGGGGWEGGTPGNNTDGNPSQLGGAMAQGMIFADTDTGHTCCGANATFDSTWALNNSQAIENFAYRGLHLTVLEAKTLAMQYYGHAVKRSYYNGCSTGGRQGWVEAQRFPNDFDGEVVGSPVYSAQLYTQFAWTTQEYQKAPFTLAQINAVGASLLTHCAESATGLIVDPRRCTFNPAIDGASLTPAQLHAYMAIVNGPSNSRGQLYTGQAFGAEVGDGYVFTIGVDPTTGTATPLAQEDFAQGFFTNIAGYPNGAGNINVNTLNFETDPYRFSAYASISDASDSDLSAYAKLGHKVIAYHGWADPLVTSLSSIVYAESVFNTMGMSSALNTYRLFMMPGMGHCGDEIFGGYGPDGADFLTPLMKWVESGVAPANIVAYQGVPGELPYAPGTTFTGERSRLLCPYPQEGDYQSGDPTSYTSFQCVQGVRGAPPPFPGVGY